MRPGGHKAICGVPGRTVNIVRDQFFIIPRSAKEAGRSAEETQIP